MAEGNLSQAQGPMRPDDIVDMAGSFWVSAILKAGIELDVFTEIAAGNDTVEKVASSIKASERGVRILLNALCSLGMISKAEGKYLLTPTAEQFLVKGKDSYMGYAIFTTLKDWEAVGRIAEAVKKGSPITGAYGAESEVWEEVAIGLTPSGLTTASVDSGYTIWTKVQFHGCIADRTLVSPRTAHFDTSALAEGLRAFIARFRQALQSN